jgi:hypothetical protein
VVIFGLLLGEALLGFLGILLALPLLVILREATVFGYAMLRGEAPVTAPAEPAAAEARPPPA